jgi:hypothetical protein
MTSLAWPAASARVRAAWLAPALAFVVAAVVVWWAATPYLVGVFHDDGVYAVLARSLATLHGFRYEQLPGSPPATHYPPLYPIALALVWRVAPDFPGNISALLALNAVAIGIAAAGLQRLLHAWFGWRDEPAALVAIIALLGVPILTLAGALMSEPLFLAALPPVLLLTQRALDEDDDRRALIAGLAVGLASLVRAHGIALLGAAVLLLLSRGALRRALVLGATAVVVQLPWAIWCALATPRVASPLSGTYGPYASFFIDGWHSGGLSLLAATIRTNLHELWLLLGDRVWGGLGVGLGTASALALVALMALGAWRAWRVAPVLPAFLLLYFAIIVVMSCAPYRYAWGAWPFLVVLAVVGAVELQSRAGTRGMRALLLLAAALPCAAMARTEFRGYRVREWEQPARRATPPAAIAVEWIRRNTPPHARVLAEAPEIVALFADREAAPPEPFTAREYIVPLTSADHARGLRAMQAAVNARYLVTFTPGVQQAARASSTWRAIAIDEGVEIYEARQ